MIKKHFFHRVYIYFSLPTEEGSNLSLLPRIRGFVRAWSTEKSELGFCRDRINAVVLRIVSPSAIPGFGKLDLLLFFFVPDKVQRLSSCQEISFTI